jgi:hypothetical protein
VEALTTGTETTPLLTAWLEVPACYGVLFLRADCWPGVIGR